MATLLTPELVASLWTPSDPQVSPDGRRVAWTAAPFGKEGEHTDQGIWVAQADDSAEPRRWTYGAEDTHPRWSPDGSRLAFLSDREKRGTHGLYVLDATGGEATPVVVRKASVAGFAWSPDGDRIAFLAPDEPTDEDERREKERDDADVFGERWKLNRLWFVAATGGEPEVGWAPTSHLTELAWSPDSSRLALLGQDSPLNEHQQTRRLYLFGLAMRTRRSSARRPMPATSAGPVRTRSSTRRRTRWSRRAATRPGPCRPRVGHPGWWAPGGMSPAARSASRTRARGRGPSWWSPKAWTPAWSGWIPRPPSEASPRSYLGRRTDCRSPSARTVR